MSLTESKLISNEQVAVPKPRNAKFEDGLPTYESVKHQDTARATDVVDGNQSTPQLPEMNEKSENETEERVLESKESSSLSQFSEGKGENKMQVNQRKVNISTKYKFWQEGGARERF